MTKTHLLSTAAIVLMLGASAALAQAPAKDQAPAQPAPAAQQNAPAEKVAPPSQSVEKKAGEIKANDAKPTAQAPQPNAPKTAADSGKADLKTPPAAGKAEIKGAAGDLVDLPADHQCHHLVTDGGGYSRQPEQHEWALPDQPTGRRRFQFAHSAMPFSTPRLNFC